MKSVKPGRGPSMMGGIIGICVALFGVFWTILTIISGAGFMAVFGVIFTIIAIVQVIYNFKNATGKNRYSHFDITDENEESDPFNERFGREVQQSSANKCRFCPYCGAEVKQDFEFCSSCGKVLPD